MLSLEAKQTVSVIIPCYDQSKYLQEALDSIEDSTYKNIEVIVVDDGSNFKEQQEILDICQRGINGQEIILIRQNNKGVSAARNAGICKASGDYLLMLDADDKIAYSYIEKAVWVLNAYPEYSFVYTSVKHFGFSNDIWHSRHFDMYYLLHHNYIVVSSLFRSSICKDIGTFDSNITGYEDWDFWIRAGGAGHKGFWLKEPLFFYRKVKDSKLQKDDRRKKEIEREIREKNRQIFNDKQNYLKSSGEESISANILTIFKVFMVQRVSYLPLSIKKPLKRIVKPILLKMNNKNSNDTVFQIQTLHETHIDKYLMQNYQYKNNIKINNKDNDELNILFIVPWLVIGGADKVNLDLASQFTAKRNKVHVMTTLEINHPWEEEFKVVTKSISHLGNLFDKLDHLMDYVLDYILHNNIKIIQISNSQLGYQMTPTIKKYFPDIIIVDLLHMEEPNNTFDYFRYSIRYKNHINHRITITEYLRTSLMEKYEEQRNRVSVISNGIEVFTRYGDTEYSNKVLSNKGIVTIGFVGRLEPQKNPEHVVQIARILKNKIMSFKLIIVGDGSLYKSIKKMANKYELSNEIEFMGYRNNAAEIMKQKIDILIAPSEREGLPIVGLEAMSLGIPIIAYDVEGWKELIKNNETGILVKKNDYIRMAELCIDLIHNVALRKKISLNAFIEIRDKYSIKKISDKYLELYEKLLVK